MFSPKKELYTLILYFLAFAAIVTVRYDINSIQSPPEDYLIEVSATSIPLEVLETESLIRRAIYCKDWAKTQAPLVKVILELL